MEIAASDGIEMTDMEDGHVRNRTLARKLTDEVSNSHRAIPATKKNQESDKVASHQHHIVTLVYRLLQLTYPILPNTFRFVNRHSHLCKLIDGNIFF